MGRASGPTIATLAAAWLALALVALPLGLMPFGTSRIPRAWSALPALGTPWHASLAGGRAHPSGPPSGAQPAPSSPSRHSSIVQHSAPPSRQGVGAFCVRSQAHRGRCAPPRALHPPPRMVVCFIVPPTPSLDGCRFAPFAYLPAQRTLSPSFMRERRLACKLETGLHATSRGLRSLRASLQQPGPDEHGPSRRACRRKR